MNDTILTLASYAVTAFAITLVVYVLTMILGIYSVVLLVALIALTAVSLSKILRRENVKFSDALPALFIPILVFVIVSVILAFFTGWMIWIAIPALMYVIYMNIVEEKDEMTEALIGIREGSKALQGKSTLWGTPFYPLTRFIHKLFQDITKTTYAFSLCALYVCTTMIITPFSLPLYTPLIIWAVFLVMLILVARREGVSAALEHMRNLKHK